MDMLQLFFRTLNRFQLVLWKTVSATSDALKKVLKINHSDSKFSYKKKDIKILNNKVHRVVTNTDLSHLFSHNLSFYKYGILTQ